MALIPLVLAVPFFAAMEPSEFKVVEFYRHAAFAGKLGNRIDDVLIVTANGQQYKVRLGRAHTRFGEVEAFHAGDTITLKGVRHGDEIFALRSDVSKR